MNDKKISFPWWEKYTLTIEEASIYFGIGERTLRRFISEHKNENFVIYNGSKILIKKKQFETYIDKYVSAI